MTVFGNDYERALYEHARTDLGVKTDANGNLLDGTGTPFTISVDNGRIEIWGGLGCWRSIELARPDALDLFDAAVKELIGPPPWWSILGGPTR